MRCKVCKRPDTVPHSLAGQKLCILSGMKFSGKRSKSKGLNMANDEAVKREWFNRGCAWGYDAALSIIQARFESQLEQVRGAECSIYFESPEGFQPSRLAN